MDPQELRTLCEVPPRVVSDDVGRFGATLQPDHPLDTLMAEHQLILGALEELDRLNKAVKDTDKLRADQVEQLEDIVRLLVGAEPHHQREEEALFPELERRGLAGPPRVMRTEDVELRQRKHALLDLSTNVVAIPYSEFAARLNELTTYLVYHLRDHIFKEHDILYPAAARTVTDPSVWDDIKAQSDRIGWCSFTPLEQ